MIHNFKSLSALILSSFLLISCAVFNKQETAGQYIDDATITTRIKAAFAGDNMLKAHQIGVETLCGEVQLSGFVSSHSEATRAAVKAKKVKGVVSVSNDIKVRH